MRCICISSFQPGIVSLASLFSFTMLHVHALWTSILLALRHILGYIHAHHVAGLYSSLPNSTSYLTAGKRMRSLTAVSTTLPASRILDSVHAAPISWSPIGRPARQHPPLHVNHDACVCAFAPGQSTANLCHPHLCFSTQECSQHTCQMHASLPLHAASRLCTQTFP